MRGRTPFLVAGALVAAVLSLAPARRPDNCYEVLIDSVSCGALQFSGLAIDVRIDPYRDGDDPLTRKLPGPVNYGDVTLRRAWLAASTPNDFIESSRTVPSTSRRTLAIVLRNADGGELKRWNFFECVPKSRRLFEASVGRETEFVEELVFAIEWFEEA